ncbi:Flagellar motor switch protein FliM [hydrothermal vent metagenome]|uniref:Flagellar motor switch protein FliM n=1 Tax=hydrothermal vent metagenome TaxID=652676 RepID=A0A3B1D179_9ZZZZ
MSDILSQDEVDALLKGVKEGDVETRPQVPPDGIRVYDLTNQERIIRGRMPGLEMVNEKFAGLFRVSLSNFISKFIDVTAQGISIIKFEEFMKTISLPSSINIFKIHPLKGHALMVLEAPLIFALVEYFFGGNSASPVKTGGRGFTPVEQRLISKVLTIALGDIQNALAELVDVKTELAGTETNPQFVTLIPQTETLIKVEFHVEMENLTGKLYLGIPYSLFEPIKEKLYSGNTSNSNEVDKVWIKRLVESLNESFVNITVELDRAELKLKDVLNLQTGDIITLGKSVADELVVKVEGVPKFYCTPGHHRGSQAVKITRAIEMNYERSHHDG